MGAVRMMEAPLDEMVDVVAMRNRLMTAPGPMGMAGFVTIAAELRRAPVRVLGADLNHVLVDAIPILLVQMSVMREVDMVAVLHGEVAALRAVMMGCSASVR